MQSLTYTDLALLSKSALDDAFEDYPDQQEFFTFISDLRQQNNGKKSLSEVIGEARTKLSEKKAEKIKVMEMWKMSLNKKAANKDAGVVKATSKFLKMKSGKSFRKNAGDGEGDGEKADGTDIKDDDADALEISAEEVEHEVTNNPLGDKRGETTAGSNTDKDTAAGHSPSKASFASKARLSLRKSISATFGVLALASDGPEVADTPISSSSPFSSPLSPGGGKTLKPTASTPGLRPMSTKIVRAFGLMTPRVRQTGFTDDHDDSSYNSRPPEDVFINPSEISQQRSRKKDVVEEETTEPLLEKEKQKAVTPSPRATPPAAGGSSIHSGANSTTDETKKDVEAGAVTPSGIIGLMKRSRVDGDKGKGAVSEGGVTVDNKEKKKGGEEDVLSTVMSTEPSGGSV